MHNAFCIFWIIAGKKLKVKISGTHTSNSQTSGYDWTYTSISYSHLSANWKSLGPAIAS